MPKKLVTVILLLSFSLSNEICYGQNVSWAKSFGNNAYDYADELKLDLNNNLVVAGTFTGTVDFDPGPGLFQLSSNAMKDAYLMKLDNAGNFLWGFQIGGADDDYIVSIAVDASNNILVSGGVMGYVDFDPGPSSFTVNVGMTPRGFIAKYDPSGNFLWAGLVGSMAVHLTPDLSRNIYVSGNYTGNTNDVDPGVSTYSLPTGGSFDAFVEKIDSSGNFLWANPIASSGLDIGGFLTVDGSSNILASGYFSNTVDFDPGTATFSLSSFGQSDTYLAKYDNMGNFLWAKQFGGTGPDYGLCVKVDGSHIYGVGWIQGPGDYDPGPGTYTMGISGAAFSDVYMLKLDLNGNFVWAKKTSGTYVTQCPDFQIYNNELYLAGQFNGTTDFDPSPSTYSISTNYEAGFMCKLDTSGAFLGAFKLGGYSRFSTVNLDMAGNIYASGGSTLSCDFDPGAPNYTVPNNGYTDGFCVKYGPGVLTGLIEESDEISLSIYPNPTSGNFKIDISHEGELSVEIYNSLGELIKAQKTESSNEIDLTSFSSGIYLITLKEGNKIIGRTKICKD